ncbi:aspartate/glutamate racemase family protein [Lentibacillus sediminis]|uniref:aspartate/glutamate racemase family protein n=1 Tax=Lentibacillus sediminis TaxID=1940529 RepID=UPI000C1C5BD8|nr:amino acid racemase [Lentibacillus sediminis]
MTGKRLGVLGGMGPMATSVFFENMVKKTKAEADQEHIDTVVLNHTTLPDRTDVILEQKEEEFLQAVEKDLRLFEQAEVANIAIPCNTSHYFMEQMQEMTRLPIINMVDETVKHIANVYGKGAKVGILATDGTISTGVYQESCERHQLLPWTPDDQNQEKIMRLIYHYKQDKPVQPDEAEVIMQQLIQQEKCTCLILGCTELSCIDWSDTVYPYCVDALEMLVDRSIRLSGKHVKSLSPFKNIVNV